MRVNLVLLLVFIADLLAPQYGSAQSSPASCTAHGFLAIPGAAPIPEPSAVLLLTIGTLGVIGWSGRRDLRTD
jgi:hypothetical protein